MAYLLQIEKPPASECRRIVVECLDDALAQLEKTGDARDEGIHETRKRCKEIRALLRLFRGSLGKHYRRENAAYRDIAGRLSGSRDLQAMVEVGEKLAGLHEPDVPQNERDELLRFVRGRRDRGLRESGAVDEEMAAARRDLRQRREELADWPEISGFPAAGLKRHYRRGREAMEEARAELTDEALHEWRKRAKDYRYHTKLLQKVWPKVMKSRRRELEKLTGMLGEERDLALLASAIETEAEDSGAQAVARTWLPRIASRREKLREAAFSLGGRIYAEKPKAMKTRIGSWWSLAGGA
jgi:CHAD domain-containing protein